MNNGFNNFSGNRFNLRSKPTNSIKRVEAISYALGALGDFLVTTWGSVIAAISLLAGGVLFIFAVLNNSPKAIILSNLLPTLLIALGIILLALNVALTNPVQGSQFKVSSKFLWNKVSHFESKKRKPLKIFKFWDKGDGDSVIEVNFKSGVKNQHWYIAVYSVRGVVSPVTFDSDLEIAAQASEDLLLNNERDTVFSTTVAIDKTSVRKKQLPSNATPEMIKKRDLQYDLTSKRSNNQQIKTIVTIAAPTEELLRQRVQHFESACQRGLVVGYKRLRGKEAKKSFQGVYGEGSI